MTNLLCYKILGQSLEKSSVLRSKNKPVELYSCPRVSQSLCARHDVAPPCPPPTRTAPPAPPALPGQAEACLEDPQDQDRPGALQHSAGSLSGSLR